MFYTIIMCLLFPLPMAFLLNYLFRNVFVKKSLRYLISYIAGYMVSGVIVALFLLLYTADYGIIRAKEFDRTEWQTDIGKRYKMVEDVVDTRILIHKSSAEVRQLLGKPTEESPGRLTYYCGYTGRLHFTFYTLIILIEDERVVTAYIQKDRD